MLGQGERILLIDDWVETGGQLRGLTKLLEKRGAVVSGISVLGFNTAGASGKLRDAYTLASIFDYHAPDKRDLTQRLDRR